MKPNLSRTPAGTVDRFQRGMVSGVLLIATAAWIGCGGKHQATAEDRNPVGVYQLISVNGSTVPTKISHDRVQLEIRAGTFTFDPEGKCRSKMVFVPPGGREATREVNATYTRDGSELTMRWEGAGLTRGRLQGDTFTMNNEGMALAYRK